MLVKFNFGTKGDSITLAARDAKGRETDSMRDAIKQFERYVGGPFELASASAERKAASVLAPISPARAAEIRAMFPNLFPA